VTRAGKPFSAACERNRDPILQVLRSYFSDRSHVLEIGSGTGQHAVHFAAALPHLVWQTSDRSENLPGIRAWLDEAGLLNTPGPLEFDVAVNVESVAPGTKESSASSMTDSARRYDAIFSANTLHIMSWPEVAQLFARLPALVTADAKLAIYGPFNYDGSHTSASNAAFDESLKAAAPHMGIRDAADVDVLARGAGFELVDDIAMPANNRCRFWQRVC
jgi:cyclopropane fatty-acyl-phospholipid synthase-like methyltransferase